MHVPFMAPAKFRLTSYSQCYSLEQLNEILWCFFINRIIVNYACLRNTNWIAVYYFYNFSQIALQRLTDHVQKNRSFADQCQDQLHGLMTETGVTILKLLKKFQFTPQTLKAVQILFSPMASGWVVDSGQYLFQAVSQKL